MHLHPYTISLKRESNTNMYFSVSPQRTYLDLPKRQRYLLEYIINIYKQQVNCTRNSFPFKT